jgi:hypothetical protein
LPFGCLFALITKHLTPPYQDIDSLCPVKGFFLDLDQESLKKGGVFGGGLRCGFERGVSLGVRLKNGFFTFLWRG